MHVTPALNTILSLKSIPILFCKNLQNLKLLQPQQNLYILIQPILCIACVLRCRVVTNRCDHEKRNVQGMLGNLQQGAS